MNYGSMPGPGDLYDPDDECDEGETVEQDDYDEDKLDIRGMDNADRLERHGLEGMGRDVQG